MQVCEAAVERRLGQRGDGLEQRYGHLRADDRSGLEHLLGLGGQPVDAGRQHRPDRVRHLGWEPEVPVLPHRPGQFLQKQGIPGGFRQEVLHQGLWHRRRVQHGLHHAPAVLGTQPRQGELGRIGLLHPRAADSPAGRSRAAAAARWPAAPPPPSDRPGRWDRSSAGSPPPPGAAAVGSPGAAAGAGWQRSGCGSPGGCAQRAVPRRRARRAGAAGTAPPRRDAMPIAWRCCCTLAVIAAGLSASVQPQACRRRSRTGP